MRALIVSLLLLSGCSVQKEYIERTDHNFAVIQQVMLDLDKRISTLENATKKEVSIAK